jgi:nucleoside-diphosphate-sugar epimerase
MMKNILVLGAGGFIGNHLVEKLVAEGNNVVGADIKLPMFSVSAASKFFVGDLSRQSMIDEIFLHNSYDEVYQLAADMGGIGYIAHGNDSSVMSTSVLINANVLQACVANNVKKIFYSSSACIYPERNQLDPNSPHCEESSAYPADPDTEYGWEKLFSERLYLAFGREHDIDVKIARFHNIFGPLGTWTGGKEKAPAAICRKVAEQQDGGTVEVWGDGTQTRSFLFIDECLTGIEKLMNSDFSGPVNLGSEEMVSIDQLTDMVIKISGKKLTKKYVHGPRGVAGRNSHNSLIQEKLGWKPNETLYSGLEKTYKWVDSQVNN